MELYKKYDNLKGYIKELGHLCIAFSGGVDSTFLMAVAHDILGDNAIAVTVQSSMYPKRELENAKRFAKKIGIKHIIIDADEYDIKGFAENSKDRCYLCKHAIFEKINKIAIENGINNVADGSIADDIDDYRPGMKALEELKVLSPLKQMRLTKVEIRRLSKKMDLHTWDMPSFACLASRIPYGEYITPEKLSMIDECEQYLMDLDFKQFRVRHHGDIARIEVLPEDMHRIITNPISDKIFKKFKRIGFTYVTLDIKGYRTGSMNEKLIEYEKRIKGSDN